MGHRAKNKASLLASSRAPLCQPSNLSDNTLVDIMAQKLTLYLLILVIWFS